MNTAMINRIQMKHSNLSLQALDKRITTLPLKRNLSSIPTSYFPGKKQYRISSVHNQKDRDDVYRLVHDAYVEQGYAEPQKEGKLVYFENLDNLKETTILIAHDGDKPIGTVSVTLDNKHSVPMDGAFIQEYEAIRQENRKIAIVWRLVVHKEYRSSHKLVIELIKNAIIVASYAGATTNVSVLNQIHESFYQKIFGMRVIARSNQLISLSNLPAALMRCDKETFPKKWLDHTQPSCRFVS